MRFAHARTRDPVCGMNVDPADAIAVEHEGGRYHFCSSVCAEIFRADPSPWIEPMTHGHDLDAHAPPGHGS